MHEFVIETVSERTSLQQRRTIRSHASRNRAKKDSGVRIQSWILQGDGNPMIIADAYHSIPRSVGRSLSISDLPNEIQDYMQCNPVGVMGSMRDALYPPELCVQISPLASSWTWHLLTDPVYLSCAEFSVEAFLDVYQQRGQSTPTQYLFLKTLKLLQRRIDCADPAKAASDSTIMVVALLGMTAELINDRAAAVNHMQGLKRMVDMRGGLPNLACENPRLPAKVCRVDLALALKFGISPVFFTESISWTRFFNNASLLRHITTSESQSQNETLTLIRAFDKKFYDIWSDMREFCRFTDLASQTSHRMQPQLFSETMVSILYRLMHLSFPQDTLMESVRVAMIVFVSGIFFQWRGIGQRLAHLDMSLRRTLMRLKDSGTTAPGALILWLLVVNHTCEPDQGVDKSLQKWGEQVISNLRLQSWMEAKTMLRTEVLWVGFIYDAGLKELMR